MNKSWIIFRKERGVTLYVETLIGKPTDKNFGIKHTTDKEKALQFTDKKLYKQWVEKLNKPSSIYNVE